MILYDFLLVRSAMIAGIEKWSRHFQVAMSAMIKDLENHGRNILGIVACHKCRN